MAHVVYATAGNVNPAAICEDEDCKFKGQPIGSHMLIHPRAIRKGEKPNCPVCGGPMHNDHDKENTIAFECLWYQQFGGAARTTRPSLARLKELVAGMDSGRITNFATRQQLVDARKAPLAPRPKATPTGTTPTVPPAATASPTPAATATRPAAPSTPAAAPTPKPMPKVVVPPVAAPVAPTVAPVATGARTPAEIMAALKRARPRPGV